MFCKLWSAFATTTLSPSTQRMFSLIKSIKNRNLRYAFYGRLWQCPSFWYLQRRSHFSGSRRSHRSIYKPPGECYLSIHYPLPFLAILIPFFYFDVDLLHHQFFITTSHLSQWPYPTHWVSTDRRIHTGSPAYQTLKSSNRSYINASAAPHLNHQTAPLPS